jgi:hypothetical protein
MAVTIDLHHELTFGREEIYDKPANRMLSPKLESK